MTWLLNKFQDLLDLFRHFDFLGSLALRLYLAPVFWIAGMNKAGGMSEFFSFGGLKDLFTGQAFSGFASWLGSMSLPSPEVLAYLASLTEIFGAIFLLIGFAVRWISIPLMVTMAVAIFSVHWKNGWQFVADKSSAFASPELGPLQFEDATTATERLSAAKEILQSNGNYEWLTEAGNFVVSNNGIEMATTYFIMLLALFFLGAGKFFSVDYWLHRRSRKAYVDDKIERKRLKKEQKLARKAGHSPDPIDESDHDAEFRDPEFDLDQGDTDTPTRI